MAKLFLTLLFLSLGFSLHAQLAIVSGAVLADETPVPFANVFLKGTSTGTSTDADGNFVLKDIPAGTYTIVASLLGFESTEQQIQLQRGARSEIIFELTPATNQLNEVVISGTMKEMSRLDSPVPVEVYSPQFFKANPTPSIYESLQNVNGVRPQINCSVCNTGDIHINGLEGPYTMVLIDGMPIVSGLSTVYGLSGIPQSLIERVEVVKGPASTLYGSEAVGGLINVITKKPNNAPRLSAEVMGTSWGELNADIAGKFKAGEKAQSLLGVNYYNFQQVIDNNNDNFTDVTLQHRISLFNKWNFERKQNRIFSIAARYVYEDRWGGELNWTPEHRGGKDVYGESIYTNRWEMLGTYQLPVKERVLFMFSANGHDQNSVYGETIYAADQKIGFGQLTWNKQIGLSHDLLVGAALRYTFYDDNTPATAIFDSEHDLNAPSHTFLPGIFAQDEIALNEHNKLLLGIRYDHNSIHGSIFTPRINYKWNSHNQKNVFRISAGNGYRVANIFTEDHAALTGARDVVFLSDLDPETSWNANLNFVKKVFTRNELFVTLDASAFYTYFNNKIIADYETNPNQIIYDNLSGYAVSTGVSLNVDVVYRNFKMILGGTAMDVYSVEEGVRERQLFTEQFTGVWNIGYTFQNARLTIDYTGNIYSPMRLPLLGDFDPRSEFSPWWSIQNIQITKSFGKGWEVFGGVKNLLNWTPNQGNLFIIARANDPFDENVQYNAQGQVLATTQNPYALTFDPTYIYGPNQGIRGFLGFRYNFE